MRLIFCRARPAIFGGFALLLAACSENRPASVETPPPSPDAAETRIAAAPPETPQTIPEDPPPSELSAEPELPADAGAIERRFLTATNDPPARIAALRELKNAAPASVLTILNRLFSVERREDVKSEMLAVLGDLDHTKERDNQLALCTKALAADQPTRIRYIAIHTLVDLHDPRARGLLHSLKNDPDREVRNAAAQALSDLGQ